MPTQQAAGWQRRQPNAVDWVTPSSEGIYPIVEATLYLTTAPKSSTSNDYFKAVKRVEDEGKANVPSHLQDGRRAEPD